MKTNFLLITLILLSFSTPIFSQVQPDSLSANSTADKTKVLVTLTDGTERIGYLLSDDGREILLETLTLGKIYIEKIKIKSIKPVLEEDLVIYEGEITTKAAFSTRYYFTTNAMPIEKGENYYMINLYGPEIHYAVSPHLSVGIMTTWIASPFILALKYSFSKEDSKVKFAVGTLIGTSGYLNQFRGYGSLGWGMMTFGDRSNNITLSLGYSFIRIGSNNYYYYVDKPGTYLVNQWGGYDAPQYVEYPAIKAPVFGLGGIKKIGAKASFIFDSMVFFYNTDRSNNTYINNGNPVTSVTIGRVTENRT